MGKSHVANLTYICEHGKLDRVTSHSPRLPSQLEVIVQLVGQIAASRTTSCRLTIKFDKTDFLINQQTTLPLGQQFVVKACRHSATIDGSPYERATFRLLENQPHQLQCVMAPRQQFTKTTPATRIETVIAETVIFNLSDPDFLHQIELTVFYHGLGLAPRKKKDGFCKPSR